MFNLTEQEEKPRGMIASSLAEMEANEQAMFNSARLAAAEITPDEAAEIKALSEQTGKTFELVKADKVRAKTDVMLEKMRDVREQAPYLSKVLGDKTYMSLCQDDIDNLMKVEKTYIEDVGDIGRSVIAPIPEMAGSAFSGVWQGVGMVQRLRNNVSQKSLEIMKNAGLENTRLYKFHERNAGRIAKQTEFMNEFATETKNAADNTLGAVSDFIRPSPERQNVATKIAETVGQIGAQAAMGPVAGSLVMGLNTVDSQQQLMRDEGIYGTGRGDAAALISAVAEGIVERQSIGRYLNRFNFGVGFKRSLVRAGVNAGLEGLEEGTQNITTDLIDMYVAGIDKDWSDIGRDAATVTFYAAAGAGIFSSMQGLVPSNRAVRRQERLKEERLTNGERVNLMTAAQDRIKSVFQKQDGTIGAKEFSAFEQSGDIDDVKSAQGALAAFADGLSQDMFAEPVVAVQGLTQLGDIADASMTLKRDKQAFVDVVNKITEQSGTGVVFFDAAELKDSFGDNVGDLKAVLYQMNVDEGDFNTAVETGSDIQIPTGVYVANIAKNEQLYDQMNTIARLKQDAPSYAEVSKIVERTREDIKNYQVENKTELSPRVASSKQVYENVYQALSGLKVSKSEADAIATIWTARANTFTNGKEMLPMDWFNRATRGNLTIARNGMAAEITDKDNVQINRIPKQKDELVQYIQELRRPVKDKRKLGPTLLEFLGQRGGLKNDFGDLKAMDADKWHTQKPGRPRLMREDGVDLDDAALAAWENGYFGYGKERPDVNELLELIRDELAGNKVYTQSGEALNKQTEIKQKEADIEYMDDLVSGLGLSLMHSDVNKIADAIRAFQDKNRTSLKYEQAVQIQPKEIINDEIPDFDFLLQSDAQNDNIVDLTSQFGQAPTADDVRAYIDEVIRNGVKFATLSKDWFVDIQKGKRNRDKIINRGNFKKLSAAEQKRNNKYVVALESLLKNARYVGNKPNQKVDKKDFVEKYHYFKTAVKIGNNVYDVLFDTEQFKGESTKKPQTVHLYNVQEIKTPVQVTQVEAAFNNTRTGVNDSIANKMDPVNTLLKQSANAAVDFSNENKILLNLFKTANKSSLLHESAHIFLRDIIRSAADDSTSKAQLAILKNWFKGQEITPQNEEKFARAFEKYLMEGNAPSAELRPVFARFRAWLMDIYTSLFGIDRAAGQTINITSEIRALFDSLIATDAQIKEARRMNAQDNPLPRDYFETAEEYEIYLENLQKANDEAFDEVVERRARAIAKMREKEYLQEFKEALENARHDVGEMPKYQLLNALQQGKIKLNTQIVNRYGHKVDEKWLAEDGMMPDDVATDFGWRNADTMLAELPLIPSINDEASRIAGEQLLDRHDELFDELSIKDSAARAIYNEQTIENLVQEEIKLKGERNATKTKDILMDAVHTAGNTIIKNAILGEATNVRKYAKQALKAGEDYEYAVRNKIKDKAIAAKHRQAISSYLVKRAYEADEDVRKAEQFFNDIKGREKIIGTKYFEQIKSLLAKHGYWDTDFIPCRGFNEFTESLRQNGEPVPAVNPMLLETNHQTYWKMSYGDFMGMYDAVKSIYTIGRNARFMTKEGEREEIENVAGRLAQSISSKGGVKKKSPPDMLTEKTQMERFTDKLKNLESWLVKTEQVCIELDGGEQGQFTHEFYTRMSNAETETALELNEIDKKLADIFKGYDAATLAMKYQVGDKELTFKQILMLGLNWGNEGNREAIRCSPYGLNEFNIRQALSKLSGQDWKNIQKTWDLMESYRDTSFDLEERMTGVRPQAVKPAVVHTVYGDFKGGYFPIAFDPEKSTLVEDREIRRAMDNQFSNPQFRRITNRGFLKSRQGSVQPVLLNDLNVVKKHFVDLITDLNYREAKLDMVRLLKNTELKKTIQNRIGSQGFDGLQKWVLDAGLRQTPLSAPDRILDALRINAVKFSMAGNVKVMATQFSGLGATMSEVGALNTGRWLGHYVQALGSGDIKKYSEFILSRSKFMQLRSKELDRDLRDFYNKNLGKSKAGIMIDDKVEFLLKGIQKMDFVVSSISWRAGYEKAILENKTEQQAAEYADSVVRLTQGSGRGVDQSRIQRENSTWKMITSFYSVFNVMYNRYRRAIRDVQQGRGWHRLIREACFTWLTQSALEGLIRWLFDDDKKKKRGVASHIAEQAVGQLFATNPITFYASNALGRLASGQNAGMFKASPIAFGVYDATSRSIQNFAKGNIGKGIKGGAESVGMATGMISRAELNALEAMLTQFQKGYFDPMEYINGVKKK